MDDLDRWQEMVTEGRMFADAVWDYAQRLQDPQMQAEVLDRSPDPRKAALELLDMARAIRESSFEQERLWTEVKSGRMTTTDMVTALDAFVERERVADTALWRHMEAARKEAMGK